MNTEYQITKWHRDIDAVTDQFITEFGALSHEDLNWRPNSNIWSIAQVMEHLIVINASYYPILDQLLRGTYKVPLMGRFRFAVRFFGNFILQSVEPERSKKIKTFAIWEPSESEIQADIRDRFKDAQEELKERITACKDLIEKAVVIHSPASRQVVYTLPMAFEIIVTHEKRHLNQALEVKELLSERD